MSDNPWQSQIDELRKGLDFVRKELGRVSRALESDELSPDERRSLEAERDKLRRQARQLRDDINDLQREAERLEAEAGGA